jgi:hypothetical protein
MTFVASVVKNRIELGATAPAALVALINLPVGSASAPGCSGC